ncbi:MAG: phage major capsid protein [Candidatus Onthovivens sp.]|nr:phage major capsid protein [Candidatus Onthovivens sp.]
MNLKEKLLKQKQFKQNQIDETRAMIEKSEDLKEVRALSSTLESLRVELNDLDEMLKDAENAPAEESVDAEGRKFNPIATYSTTSKRNDEVSDKTNTIEYRKAFKDLILTRKAIPVELRVDANTKTSDVASVIPTELVAKIIEKMEESGMILREITRTAIAGGVVVPTSAVKPVATWVAEGSGSDRQKKSTGKISFSYFKLRCEISMSLEVSTMALDVFESKFVENVAIAMVQAIEKAIINGNGSTQPKGILKETPASTVTLKAKLDYADLVAVESAIPVEYENTAKWCLTKANFLKLMGMVDTNGQPIARVNYGVSGKPERTLLGREVIIVPYATEIGDNFGFVFNFADYLLNTIYDLGIATKDDWDTEDKLAKAVMSADGKVIDAGSLVLVKQASAS